MSILAEVEHVSKNYGKIKALDDVTLNVRKGEIFTLIGPNGSGKTTLLKILACIEKPDDGQVYINGERIENKNRDKAKLNTTLVFQKATLFSGSVYSNIAYGLKLRKMSNENISKAVKEGLEIVKLAGYEHRSAKKLSGGEQQRVSLARALALNTPLLFLDEPTANLDPKSVSIVEEVIRQVNQEKSTLIIIATHNMFQAQQISDRAALLMNGQVIEIGSIDEIVRKSRKLTKFARLENVFTGTSEILEEGTSRIRLGDELIVEAALQKTGRITFFISPEDIILSRTKFESSARNVFEGKIVEISDQGSLVRLKVDAGKEFVAQITKRSFVEMGLNVGSRICLTFKASSVQAI